MQLHADASEPHKLEAELVAVWETRMSDADVTGVAWDRRLAELDRVTDAEPDDAVAELGV